MALPSQAMIFVVVFITFVSLTCGQQQLAMQTCDASRRYVDLQTSTADVVLGGLFYIRDPGTSRTGCGMPARDLMPLYEAARFTLNFLNNDNNGVGYLPGVTFGMKVYDSCASEVDTLKAIQEIYPQTTVRDIYCSPTPNNQLTLGMIGPFSSWTSLAAANMAKHIPASVMSPRALSAELSNKINYPTFLRTTPTQAMFARGVVTLFSELKWQNMVIVYPDEDYSRSGYEQLLHMTYGQGLCVSSAYMLPRTTTVSEYVQALSGLRNTGVTAGVFIGPNPQAVVFLDALEQLATQSPGSNIGNIQWVFSDFDLSQPVNSRRARGMLIMMMENPMITEFTKYFSELDPRSPPPDNPWFRDWYQVAYDCQLDSDPDFAGKTPCPILTPLQRESTYVQIPYVVSTMTAIFAYAETIKSICGGQSGVCSQLRTMSPSEFHQRLMSLDFTFPSNFPLQGLRGQKISFDANGDMEGASFGIHNYNNLGAASYTFKKVGSYGQGQLTINKNNLAFYDGQRNARLATPPQSLCPNMGCVSCLFPQTNVDFTYSHGDIVIGALGLARKKGSAAMMCGAGSTEQLASLVAARWAVQQLNNPTSPNYVPGINFGSLVADVCPDENVAQSFLTNLLSGNNQLVDTEGNVIPRDNIHAFVDITDDSVAPAVSSLLSHFHIPEIQAKATQASLTVKNPLLSRAIPNDEKLALALTILLQKINHPYVQVVTSMESHLYHMAMTFRRVAARQGVCVVKMFNVDDGYSLTLQRLVVRTATTPVVVTFVEEDDVRGLLDAMVTNSIGFQLSLVVAAGFWSFDSQVLKGYENAADGLMVMDLEMSNNAAFNSYLQGLSREQILESPFLKQLYQVLLQCSLEPSTRGMYPQVCGTGPMPAFSQGPVPYVIESINKVARALGDIVNDLCQGGGLCLQFRTAQNIGQLLDAKISDIGKSGGFGIVNGEGIPSVMFKTYSQTANAYTTVATFDTQRSQLQVQSAMSSSIIVRQSTSCGGHCLECHYVYRLQDIVFRPGDVYIAGAFSVSNPAPAHRQPYMCGSVRTTNGALYTLAMMYALDKVNSGTADVQVRGVKVGGLAYDHCNTFNRMTGLITDIYGGMLGTSLGGDMMGAEHRLWPTDILSWLTDNTASSMEAAKLLDPLGVAMVSPSATANSLMEFPTFYRTIQGDDSVASAIIKIIKSIGFSYIQVAYSDGSYGEGGLATMEAAAQQEGVCIINKLKMEDPANASSIVQSLVDSDSDVVVLFMGTSDTRALLTAIVQDTQARDSLLLLSPDPYRSVVQGLSPTLQRFISLELQSPPLQDFVAYLNKMPLDNPFFARYYMALFDCNVPGYSEYAIDCPASLQPVEASPKYAPSHFTLPTMNAVYATVNAYDLTIKEFCGSNYSMPCSAFKASSTWHDRFLQNLKRVSFRDEGTSNFFFLDREGNVGYDIYHYVGGSFKKMGSYGGASLNISDTNQYQGVKSQCRGTCSECQVSTLAFSFTEGDIYLGGIFDVHQRSTNPFTCGEINTLHGFQLLQAFHFALDQVNAKRGQFANILPGTRLGGIGLDACESPIRGGTLVSNINNGLSTLARDGKIIKPAQIDAYIGSYGSDATVYLARILTDLEIPQITYLSASSKLQDERVYPYIFRTAPGDLSESIAILEFLDKHDIRYVQVLYADTTYGATASKSFHEEAKKYRVCIAQMIEFPDLGFADTDTSNNIVAKLIEKPVANTVVVFTGTAYVNAMLQAVKRSARAKNKLRFIGSTAWSNNFNAIGGVEEFARGSVTLSHYTKNIKDFDDYMASKTLANSDYNPWFEEYYQYIHICYTSKANSQYLRPCDVKPISIITSHRYAQDPGIAYVINSVYAAAFAIDKSLRELCGSDYTAVCENYRNSKQRRELIRDKLEDVEFRDPTDDMFRFIDREGSKGFEFFSIDRSPLQGYLYKKIGTYFNNSLQVDSYASEWDSTCERKDACSECPAIRNRDVRYATIVPALNPSPVTVVGFFDIHKPGVDVYRCGELNMEGFQQFLAFFYSMEQLFPSQVRVLAIDTCSSSLRVDQDLFGLLRGKGLCNSQFVTNPDQFSLANIGAVMTFGDLNTVAAARVLEPLEVPYVSPNAQSQMLDNKMHLARTIDPLSARMAVLSKFLAKLGWDFVDVIHEDNMHGVRPLTSFTLSARGHQVCLNTQIKILPDATRDDITRLLRQLNNDLGSRVVVLFGSERFIRRVLDMARAVGVLDNFVWVLAGDWDIDSAMGSLMPTYGNTLIVTMKKIEGEVTSFSNYVSNLRYSAVTANRNTGNVPREWFEEFYQTVHQCHLASALTPINQGMPNCTLSEVVDKDNFHQAKYILNTVAAAAAMSRGVKNNPTNTDVRSKILATNWRMITGSPAGFTIASDEELTLTFNSQRFWDSGYIFRVWSSKFGRTKPITKWSGGSFSSDQDFSMIEDVMGDDFESTCTNLDVCGCEVDSAITQPQTKKPSGPDDRVRNYYYYDDDDKKQYDWPIWAIVVAALTVLGLAVTVILFLFLLIAYPVRGGTTVLGYMVMVGILGIYAINFAFFLHADEATCGARRFLMGVVYMIVFGALLIKAIDNWRFGHVDYAARRYSGISSSLVLFLGAVGLVLVQCIIPIMWLILVEPTATEFPIPSGRDDTFWCDPYDEYDLGLVLSFTFVVFVVLLTAMFSALGYDTETNNYESRWILFGSIATAGCFLVWMVVTTNALPPFRDPVVTIANFANATLLLCIIPIRKAVLLVMVKREKKDEDLHAYSNNIYGSPYPTQTFDLNDYDNQFPGEKQVEF